MVSLTKRVSRKAVLVFDDKRLEPMGISLLEVQEFVKSSAKKNQSIGWQSDSRVELSMSFMSGLIYTH